MAEANAQKKQMEYIAISVLVLVALFLGITRFQKKDRDDEVFSRKKFNEKWKEVEILEAKAPQKEKAISYAVDAERAPFKSPFDEKELITVAGEDISLPAMTFQGMIWNSRRPQAIIDNEVYEVNDVIEVGKGEVAAQVKVKDITVDGIHLEYKRKVFIVRPK